MRFVILRILLPLILFLVLRYILRGIFSRPEEVARTSGREAAAPSAPGGELKKDPVCGTYVASSSGITDRSHGEVLYFCSEECRKKYRAA
jgi:YHS domain-containing protein